MDVFEAVAEPSRRALLDALIDGERTAGELVATLPGLTQPTVSRHLRVLREVGLVEVRPDAQRRIYALRADGLVAIDDWIDRYRRYWADHLDALERHLQRTASGGEMTGREGQLTIEGDRAVLHVRTPAALPDRGGVGGDHRSGRTREVVRRDDDRRSRRRDDRHGRRRARRCRPNASG